MSRWRRRLLTTAILLITLGVPGWYVLVLHSPAHGTPYPLDIAKVRALADSIPGEKPVGIRAEHVMTLTFTDAMTIAGAAWDKSPMPVYAYQLHYPSGETLIVDAAQPRSLAPIDGMVSMFDEAAYSRLLAAMERAKAIVVTHEHMDHIGGVTEHPRFAALLPALKLTREQVGNPGGMKPAVLPPAPGYVPLEYDGLHALAPGVVLLKAPGHTPGSQMVYVQRADGRELLFLGDVSWRLRNIAEVRERPLFMTAMIGENRQQVLGQFEALHALAGAEPQLRQVPGHDATAMPPLFAEGLLVLGFQ